MKFISLEWDVGEEYNDIFRAKVKSNTSGETYLLKIEISPEDDSKIIDFNCSCKGVTIPKLMNKEPNMCKHLKRLKEVLLLMGYLE